MGRRLLSLSVLLLLWPGPMAAAPAAEPDMVLYRVAKGDNLYKLAQRHFRRAGDYRLVQQLNRISDPYRLPVQRTLRIPRRLLRYERLSARVSAFRGAARLVSGGREVPIAIGMSIGEGQQIVTGPNSFVTLRLADQSVVTLPSQSRVFVDRLRRWSLTATVERKFRMVEGRARSIVTPGTGTFEFSTPAAVSAVRGTEFRISYDGRGGRSITEVLQGSVAVGPPDGPPPRETGAGFGTVITLGRGAETVQLLPPPSLVEPGRVQSDERLVFDVAPTGQASAYRLQVAQDAGFLDVAAEATSSQPRVELPPVAEGTWFVRTSAIDRNGVEGLPATYSFQRRLSRISTSLEQRRIGRFREYLFRWEVEGEGERQYRFQLARAGAGTAPLIDEPGLTARSFVITDLPPGSYSWRVETLQFVDGEVHSKWSPIEQLTISPDR